MLYWQIKSYNKLSQEELYDILRIRAKIFVVEQNCPYNDLDKKDNIAKHVIGKEGNKIIAYARIFKEGDFYEKNTSIGRILVCGEKRKKKIGHTLVEKSINFCKKNYPGKEIKISSQSHLKRFYQKLGFVYKGEAYLEDGIPHCSMYLTC
ncbi:MAG: GNAT family N-acetyltransferase [Flavobacteriaceae bacterium]|jgi:ElaA protein|nr:GNAT family N-acetyltransferase [Flavobacteriaceae bacterium]